MRLLVQRVASVTILAIAVAWWLLDARGAAPLAIGPTTQEVALPTREGTQWARYLAPEGTCRGDVEVDLPARQQLYAIRCLLDWARRERGLSALAVDRALTHSAALKAAAIVRCDEFSHTPCRSDFSATFAAVGWRGSAAENIAWGSSTAGSARRIVDGWLHSTGHRENLFAPNWRAQGIALLRVDGFQGESHAAIWVHQFGE